jgi:hypothetical protein
MSINHVNNLQNQIIETIQTLPQEQQQKVLLPIASCLLPLASCLLPIASCLPKPFPI